MSDDKKNTISNGPSSTIGVWPGPALLITGAALLLATVFRVRGLSPESLPTVLVGVVLLLLGSYMIVYCWKRDVELRMLWKEPSLKLEQALELVKSASSIASQIALHEAEANSKFTEHDRGLQIIQHIGTEVGKLLGSSMRGGYIQSAIDLVDTPASANEKTPGA